MRLLKLSLKQSSQADVKLASEILFIAFEGQLLSNSSKISWNMMQSIIFSLQNNLCMGSALIIFQECLECFVCVLQWIKLINVAQLKRSVKQKWNRQLIKHLLLTSTPSTSYWYVKLTSILNDE